MFGVAEDLMLDGLIGRTVEKLSVGAGRIELSFDDGWKLTIESGWEFSEADGRISTANRAELLDSADQLTGLIGKTVTVAEPQPPDRLVMTFGSVGRLVLIDDSEVLESFSIEPIGVIV